MPRIRIRTFTIAALLCLNSLSAGPAHARDLQGRLGIGYNGQFSSATATTSVPSISFKYGITRDLAIELLGGVATTDPMHIVGGGKLFKNIFYETNLNFYFMLGGAYLMAPDATDITTSKMGFQAIAGPGLEFFIPGIESLGFSVETGVSFDNMTGSYVIRTIGVSFLDAGIHFYF